MNNLEDARCKEIGKDCLAFVFKKRIELLLKLELLLYINLLINFYNGKSVISLLESYFEEANEQFGRMNKYFFL